MAKFIPLILFTVLTNFGSQVLLKHGMTTIETFELTGKGLMKVFPSVVFNVWVIAGLLVMIISMGSHLVVLSRVDISFAYPFLGLSFVLIALWGYFVLSEDLNFYRILGVVLICSGVALVAKS